MTRIPLAEINAPQTRTLAEQIATEWGTVLDLYQVLLHSPPVAEGWLGFLTAIRKKCTLPGSIRELVIMRIAGINGASYEAEQHASIALHEGITDAQLTALSDWQNFDGFDARQRSALEYTDAMTRDVRVPAAIFEKARREFDVRMLVELTATIAAYNMVSRFLEALEIRADHESRVVR